MKNLIKKLVNKLGYNIVRLSPTGKNPVSDMKMFITTDQPIIFDVGANVGQTITRFRSAFSKPEIYSFEPSPATFETLTSHAQNMDRVHVYNCGMGSEQKTMTFFENTDSKMSSFLQLSEFGWGSIKKETLVEINTVDQFCKINNIKRIDILKSDTQGFDFEVLRGAQSMMSLNKIGAVYLEVTFSEMYKGIPSFGHVYDFLVDNNFRLVSFYKFYYQDNLVSWTDALFLHTSLIPESVPGTYRNPEHGSEV